MAVLVRNESRHRPRVASAWLRRLGQGILRGLGRARTELSIVVCDDATIQALNRQYRGKDRPTDVLSFSQLEGEAGMTKTPSAGKLCLGDVVISLPSAARQAEGLGHSLEDEVTRLLIHGVLHLCGHDHVHGGWQARRMREEERRLWRYLGRPRHDRRA